MQVDVIARLAAIFVRNSTDIATAVSFLCESDEEGAVSLEVDGSREDVAVLSPADAQVGPRHVAAEVHGRAHMRVLLVIVRLPARAIAVFYQLLMSHAIKFTHVQAYVTVEW